MEVKLPISAIYMSLFSWIISDFIHTVHCFENDLTVVIQPSATECFFIPVKKETDIEVEFQVLDGGDLDINFYAMDPTQRMLAAQMKKSEASHKFHAKEVGDYRVCFDNTFSRFSRKVVYFEIMSTEEDVDDRLPELADIKEGDGANELVDVTLEAFKSVVTTVRGNLDRSLQHQSAIKNFEARDRNIQEANFERVNNWSLLQLFIMVSVGLVQVLMIRNLFTTHHSTIKAQT